MSAIIREADDRRFLLTFYKEEFQINRAIAFQMLAFIHHHPIVLSRKRFFSHSNETHLKLILNDRYRR